MRKKLLMLSLTALALGAFAIPTNKVGFEGHASGTRALDMKEDTAGVEDGVFWYSGGADDDDSTIAEYGSGDKYQYNGDVLVPGGPGSKYLSVDAPSAALYRSIQDNGGNKPVFLDLEGDVVVDALVQFTPGDAEVPTLDEDVKFAISLAAEENGPTNLIVTAAGRGTYGKYYGATNYVLNVANIDPDEWYRVTIRAVATLGQDVARKDVGVLGFVVYIDKQIVSCADDDYADKLPVIEDDLNATCQYLIENKQLFISRVRKGRDTSLKLSSVGFSGTGSIDDITLCNADEAEFAAIPDVFEIIWRTGITGFSYQIDDNPAVSYENTSAKAGRLVIPVASGANSVFITNIVHDAEVILQAESFTFAVAGGYGEILSSRKHDNFSIGDAQYSSLEEAIAVANSTGGVVTLNANYTTPMLDWFIVVTTNIVLDLKGNTLTVDANGYQFYVSDDYPGASLTVITSIAGGKLDYGADGSAVFCSDPDKTFLGAVEGDFGVKIDKRIGSATIIRGYLKDLKDIDDSAAFIAEGSVCSEEVDGHGYWVIEPGTKQLLGAKPTEDENAGQSAGPGSQKLLALKIYLDDGGLVNFDDANAAIEAAAVINGQKEDYIVPSNEIVSNRRGLSASSNSNYNYDYVAATAQGNDVVIKFTKEGESAAQDSADTVGELYIGDETATVSADATVPGFYYSVVSGTDLDAIEEESLPRVVGTGMKISLEAPNKGPRGFYKIKVSPVNKAKALP